ncbi:CFAP20 family protein [Photobacterium sp. BZF1]|nr:CFAP20 family protein [Photobacterium sp. BZF1]
MTDKEIHQLADEITGSVSVNNKVTIPALTVGELKILLCALKKKK